MSIIIYTRGRNSIPPGGILPLLIEGAARLACIEGRDLFGSRAEQLGKAGKASRAGRVASMFGEGGSARRGAPRRQASAARQGSTRQWQQPPPNYRQQTHVAGALVRQPRGPAVAPIRTGPHSIARRGPARRRPAAARSRHQPALQEQQQHGLDDGEGGGPAGEPHRWTSQDRDGADRVRVHGPAAHRRDGE